MIADTASPTEWLAWSGTSRHLADSMSHHVERILATIKAVHDIAETSDAWANAAEQMWNEAYAAWSSLPEESRRQITNYPAIGAWAASLRKALARAIAGGPPMREDLARHLARFVIAANFNERRPATIRLYWNANWVLSLPDAPYAWRVADDIESNDPWNVTTDGHGTLLIRNAAGRVLLDVGADDIVHTGSSWQLGSATLGARSLVADWADPCFALEFDGCFPHDQHAGLSGSDDAPEWGNALKDAVSLVHSADPSLAEEMLDTIRVVVPLKAIPNYHVSRVEADTLGAIWCSLTDSEPLAEALVHEYGHTKLHLLQRALTLVSSEYEDAPRFFSPWRPDARPLDGILHGAFVAVWVTRFWHRLYERTVQDRHRSRWQRCAARAVGAVRELSDPTLFTSAGWTLIQALQREALWYSRRAAGSQPYDEEESDILARRQKWAFAIGQPASPPEMNPLSIPTFVVKVASRCNLDCSYCYEYKFADQSWRRQRRFMSEEIARQLGLRMAEHARANGLRRMEVCLHGGEPLLLGRERLGALVRAMREATHGTVELKLGVQTNGILLDEKWIDFFIDENIIVGVSLDGPEAINDRQRLDHNGRGTHASVVTAIKLLAEHGRNIFAGLLCVIDPTSDPPEVFDHLLSFGAPNIDFLLPHDSWDLRALKSEHAETLRRAGWRATQDDVPTFGRWLAEAFDHYLASTSGRTRVRFFDELVRVLLGQEATLESMGLAEARLLTISPDGELQGVDTLKITREGAVTLGLNVFNNTINEASRHPEILARNIGRETLCETCRSCPYVMTCGGGYMPHRWHTLTGFDNPSVYCADLRHIIDHVRDKLVMIGESLT